jgi:hypothetical protein
MKKTVNSTKIAYIHELSLGICKIVFKKETNGRFRSILGTLNKQLIPGKHQKTLINTISSKENPDLIPIFDVKERKWKSFYIKNIINFISSEKLRKNTKY